MLVVINTSVKAEWVVIGVNDNSTYYANPDTIRKSGNKVKMWVLLDMNTIQESLGDKYLSMKAQEQFDCSEEQRKVLYLSQHSKNMGGGDVVYSGATPDSNWFPVSPESMNELAWKFACGK